MSQRVVNQKRLEEVLDKYKRIIKNNRFDSDVGCVDEILEDIVGDIEKFAFDYEEDVDDPIKRQILKHNSTIKSPVSIEKLMTKFQNFDRDYIIRLVNELEEEKGITIIKRESKKSNFWKNLFKSKEIRTLYDGA